MDHINALQALCFLFSIGFYVSYLPDIISGKAKPTLSSWISWGIMDSAILSGMLVQGEISWQLVAYVIGTTILLTICIWKRAAMDWKRLDTFCLSASAFAGVLWVITGEPNIAIVLSLIAMTIGSVPMFVNTWRNPGHEPLLPWTIAFVGGIFSVLSIETWSIAAALTPMTLFALSCVFMMIRLRRFSGEQHARA